MLVDDHELVRMGLQTLLEGIEGVSIVAEAGSGAEALDLAEHCQPDVAILDIRMPGMDGIEVCRQITTRWPAIQIIMLTSYADDS